MHVNSSSTKPDIFGYTDRDQKKKDRAQKYDVATAEKDLRINCINDTIIWPQGVTHSFVTTELDQIYWLWHVHSL